jgi:hypothetical protein
LGSKEIASMKSKLQPDVERVEEDVNQDEQQVNSEDIQRLPIDSIQQKSYKVATNASSSEYTIGILHLWVFQVRQLAFRRIFYSIHDRYGLHIRCYLSKGSEKLGDIYESKDKSYGNMMNPVWRHSNDDLRTQTRGHFAIPLTTISHESDLNIEIICGILVVASAKLPMTVVLSSINSNNDELDISKDIQHRWLPLIGVNNGALEIATKVVGSRNCYSSITVSKESPTSVSIETPLSPRSVRSNVRRKRFEWAQPNLVKTLVPQTLNDEINELNFVMEDTVAVEDFTIENNSSHITDNEEKELWDIHRFGSSECATTSPSDSIFSCSQVSNISEKSTVSEETTACASEFLSYGSRIHDLESKLKTATTKFQDKLCITRKPTPGIILFDPNALPENERKDFISSRKKDLTRRRRSLPTPIVRQSKDNCFFDKKERPAEIKAKKSPVSAPTEEKTLRRHRSESIHGFADFLKKTDYPGYGISSTPSNSHSVVTSSTNVQSTQILKYPLQSRRHSTGQTPAVGTFIRVGDCPGVVRYFGPTQFASGVWIGIELCEPKGKNDGSVNDVKVLNDYIA